MPYTAEISFAPANELMMSFHTFQCKKAHKRLDMGMTWVSDTAKTLSKSFAAEVKELGEWHDWELLKLLGWQCPKKETAEQFLDWLEKLSPGDMYELLSPWVRNFPEDLGTVRDRNVHFLTEWNRQYFSKLDPAILNALQADANQKRQLLKQMGPVELTDLATNGLHFEEVEGEHILLLSPQYHYQPVTLLAAYEGITVCQYAINELPFVEEGEPSPKLFRLTRALADKTRLKILRYLGTGPKSFMEIVSHMGMAKSTIYEHMLNLRSAGLVRGHVSGESVQTYALRSEALDALNDQLASYLNA